MDKKGVKVRCGGTWTESRYWQFIRSALRAAFSRYPVRFQVLNNAKRAKQNGGRQKWEYKCNKCKKWYKSTEIQVDHIIPAGSLKNYRDLMGFTKRLFCEADGLQVLCKPCHKVKTLKERKK